MWHFGSFHVFSCKRRASSFGPKKTFFAPSTIPGGDLFEPRTFMAYTKGKIVFKRPKEDACNICFMLQCRLGLGNLSKAQRDRVWEALCLHKTTAYRRREFMRFNLSQPLKYQEEAEKFALPKWLYIVLEESRKQKLPCIWNCLENAAWTYGFWEGDSADKEYAVEGLLFTGIDDTSGGDIPRRVCLVKWKGYPVPTFHDERHFWKASLYPIWSGYEFLQRENTDYFCVDYMQVIPFPRWKSQPQSQYFSR